MNDLATRASNELFIFLHADSDVSEIDFNVYRGLQENEWSHAMIRFDSRLSYMKFVTFTSNLRTRWLKIVYSDQAFVIPKPLFEKLGGFDENERYEDLAMSIKLRPHKRVLTNQIITTSARRFEKHGPLKTHLVMGAIQWSYLLGLKRLSKRLYARIK